MTEYGYKASAITHGDPQDIGETLEQLRESAGGELTPAVVVKAAKAKRSPLHDWFEWDETSAARKYRLAQASYLIRTVVIIIDDDHPPVRAFVRVSERREGPARFLDVRSAMEDSETREIVLGRAKRQLRIWRDEYGRLREFAALIESADFVQVTA